MGKVGESIMHSVFYCIPKRYHFGISLFVSWKECFFCLSRLHYLNSFFLVIRILCLLWANCYLSICGSSHLEFIENHQFYNSKISKKSGLDKLSFQWGFWQRWHASSSLVFVDLFLTLSDPLCYIVLYTDSRPTIGLWLRETSWRISIRFNC